MTKKTKAVRDMDEALWTEFTAEAKRSGFTQAEFIGRLFRMRELLKGILPCYQDGDRIDFSPDAFHGIIPSKDIEKAWLGIYAGMSKKNALEVALDKLPKTFRELKETDTKHDGVLFGTIEDIQGVVEREIARHEEDEYASEIFMTENDVDAAREYLEMLQVLK